MPGWHERRQYRGSTLVSRFMAVTWPDGGLPSPPRSRSHFARISPEGRFQPGRPLSDGFLPDYFPRSLRYLVFLLVQYTIIPAGTCQEGGVFFRRSSDALYCGKDGRSGGIPLRRRTGFFSKNKFSISAGIFRRSVVI